MIVFFVGKAATRPGVLGKQLGSLFFAVFGRGTSECLRHFRRLSDLYLAIFVTKAVEFTIVNVRGCFVAVNQCLFVCL